MVGFGEGRDIESWGDVPYGGERVGGLGKGSS